MSDSPYVWPIGDDFPIEVSVIDPITGFGLAGIASYIGLTMQRLSDGHYWTGAEFQSGSANLAMSEVTDSPGLYRYLFTGNDSTDEERYSAHVRIDAPTVKADAYELHVCRRDNTPHGIRQVTISVVDGVDAPVPSVTVAVYDATNTTLISRGTTGPSGEVDFALDDATYSVRLARVGYTFSTPQVLIVSDDARTEYEGSAWVPTAPSELDKCMLYDWVVDAAGQPVSGATIDVYAAVPGSAGDHQLANPIVTHTTASDGYVEFELLRNARVKIMAPALGFEDTKKTVPDAVNKRLSTW